MFQIIHVPSGRILKAVYADGRTAATRAAALSKRWGVKYQPRPIINNNYHEREGQRQNKKYDFDLPWMDTWNSRYKFWSKVIKTMPKYTYPRISKTLGMVAYFETEAKAMLNQLTDTTPGRFLEQFADEYLTKEEIRDLATEYSAKYGPIELKWATTPEDIEKVFRYGPQTCMARLTWPADRVHPARVYASPDLKIAYLGDLDAKRVTSRGVVYEAKKVYAGAYGDGTRLRVALEQAGYTQYDKFHGGGPFVGVRLNKIVENNYYVGGHIDYFPYFHDAGDHLVVCEGTSKPHGAFTTAGIYAVDPEDRGYTGNPVRVRGNHEANAA